MGLRGPPSANKPSQFGEGNLEATVRLPDNFTSFTILKNCQIEATDIILSPIIALSNYTYLSSQPRLGSTNEYWKMHALTHARLPRSIQGHRI